MTGTHLPGALAAALVLVSTARAGPPTSYDVQVAFAEADTNKNGSIGIDEYYDRLVELYFHGDTNKDGTLSPEEFSRAVVIQEPFAQVDLNGDGKVDRREFVRARLPIFQSTDTDKDGELSLAEVKAAFEVGSAK